MQGLTMRHGLPVVLITTVMAIATNALAAPAPRPAPAPSTPGTDATAAQTPVWEIKGVRLGSTVAQFTAAFANAKCDKFADPAIQSCVSETTLAGAQALLHTKYLDGQAIYVGIENITWDQTRAGANALRDKYGAPTRSRRVHIHVRNSAGDPDVISEEIPVWENGDVQLYPDKTDWHDAQLGVAHGSILLVDMHKHNDVWIQKYNGKKPAAPGDI